MKTKNSLILMVLFMLTVQLFAQKDTIYSISDEMPSFKGGIKERTRFINENLIYPVKARRSKVQGTVYSTFVVNTDGSLSDIKTISGIGSGCDDAVVRVIKLMPPWNPGKIAGKAVRVEYTLPVKFAIDVPKVIVKDTTIDTNKSLKFTIVEDMPQYIGGDKARIEFLKENIKYPLEALNKKIQGSVYVTFVINEDGSLSNIKILKGIGGGCDEEVLRVVKLMPNWKPGKQKGKPVMVQFNMPVKFTL